MGGGKTFCTIKYLRKQSKLLKPTNLLVAVAHLNFTLIQIILIGELEFYKICNMKNHKSLRPLCKWYD